VFAYYFAQAAIGCQKNQVPEHCQTLANLCVLTLYNQANAVCDFLKTQVAGGAYTDEFSDTVPWIEFTAENGVNIISSMINDAGYEVTAQMELQNSDSTVDTHLNFQLAMYDINGTFLGFSELAEQIFICPQGFQDILKMRSFGTQLVAECEFQLSSLKQSKDSDRLPSAANIFYELYLVDNNQRAAIVPVVVRNYMKDNSARTQPNQGSDSSNWVLTRRFFVYDTLSGIVGGSGLSYNAGIAPEYVRWASDLSLKIELSNEAAGQILRPHIIVEYSEAHVETINEETYAPAKLTVEYFSTYTSVMSSFYVAFGIFLFLSLFWAIIRLCFY
jgi:hypothetical protein